MCQMLSGRSTTAAAHLAGQLPADEEYLRKKRVSFGAIRNFKQTQ
jgi:hypothetical protein